MGAYLSSPKKDKDSEDVEAKGCVIGASSMQGWRTNMEDAHLVKTGFDGDETAFLVGVFDGHGGREVFINIVLSTDRHYFRDMDENNDILYL